VKGREESVHLGEFPQVQGELIDESIARQWEELRQVREEVMRVLEQARQSKLIGNALEAKVKLSAQGSVAELLETYQTRLADICIVSQVELGTESLEDGVRATSIEGLEIAVVQADGAKCERCWKWLKTVGQNEKHPGLCAPCAETLSGS